MGSNIKSSSVKKSFHPLYSSAATNPPMSGLTKERDVQDGANPLAVTPISEKVIKVDSYPPCWTPSLAGSIRHADFCPLQGPCNEKISPAAVRNVVSDPGWSKWNAWRGGKESSLAPSVAKEKTKERSSNSVKSFGIYLIKVQTATESARSVRWKYN